MKAMIIKWFFMKRIPTWMQFFTPTALLIFFAVCTCMLNWFPVTKNFLSVSLIVYLAISLIIWAFYAMPYCSRHVIFVICWLIIGTLIISFTSAFLSLMVLGGIWNIRMSSIFFVLIVFIIMAICSVYFIFANKNKDKLFLDRVKVSIYISAVVFSISLSVSNMYSINITDYYQVPVPFKINPSSLQAIGINPRNFATYMLTLLTFPFLSLNALLRALIEWLNYQSKKKTKKAPKRPMKWKSI